MMSFLENASGSRLVAHPANLNRLVADAVRSIIQYMNMVLAVNVHGSDVFQKPISFPKQMLHSSFVLECITSTAAAGVHPGTGQLLPPSPLDGQHLNEWRETADYAATTLSLVAGIVDLETGFKSPLLGGSDYWLIICLTVLSEETAGLSCPLPRSALVACQALPVSP
jgi:hypothetical protein